MLYVPDPAIRRRALIALVLTTSLIAAAIGFYLAVGGRSPAVDRSDAPAAPVAPEKQGSLSPTAAEALSIQSISSGEAFTKAVAHALFDWDTSTPIPLSQYAGRMLTVADPTGSESAGLVRDLAAYLPTADAWAQLKRYYTRQWIEIRSIQVPGRWAQAEAEAGPDGFAPGTTAYTVRGTRHRAGVWEGEDVVSTHDLSFTAFVVCAPTYPTCRLLRLSRLNDPLE